MTDSEKLDLIVSKIGAMDQKIGTMDQKIETMDQKIDVLTERVEKTEGDITEIRLCIENNITKQITFIAEGHMMLMDKFDEALSPAKKIEMMQLQISILEEKVRKLERRIPA